MFRGIKHFLKIAACFCLSLFLSTSHSFAVSSEYLTTGALASTSPSPKGEPPLDSYPLNPIDKQIGVYSPQGFYCDVIRTPGQLAIKVAVPESVISKIYGASIEDPFAMDSEKRDQLKKAVINFFQDRLEAINGDDGKSIEMMTGASFLGSYGDFSPPATKMAKATKGSKTTVSRQTWQGILRIEFRAALDSELWSLNWKFTPEDHLRLPARIVDLEQEVVIEFDGKNEAYIGNSHAPKEPKTPVLLDDKNRST